MGNVKDIKIAPNAPEISLDDDPLESSRQEEYDENEYY